VLSGTDAWFWLVTGTGCVTLLVGAYVAIFQHDLKGLLAYSTISHLGLITLLLGLNTELAPVAASSTSSTTRPSRPRCSWRPASSITRPARATCAG
jgi:NADH:ubiquinone oxidoreductase subunit 5 (subunit L)/multisubunit Na+/H+ antiporter MnhA subunit